MPNPNSLPTKVRIRLSQWIDPHPDKGEAWCMDCTLNGGRTIILNANGHREHVEAHRTTQPMTSIAMRVNYGQVGDADNEGP
jgi:hypothetical protein